MLLLIAYGIAWSIALPVLHVMAALERIAFTLSGKRVWPAHWRLSERLSVKGSSNPDNLSDDQGGARKEFSVRPPHPPLGGERQTGGDAIWLHAASLGECKGLWAFAQTLCADLETKISAGTILLTTNTVTGLDFLRLEFSRLPEAERARYAARLAPLDHPRLAQRFIRMNRVRALVLFEVELWPHWVAAARRAGVPTMWISARLTQRARTRYAGNPLFAGADASALGRVLRNIDWIQTQTEDEEHALRRLGAANVETGVDLRGLHYLAGLRLTSTALGANRSTTASDSVKPRSGIAFVSLHAYELPAIIPKLTSADTGNPLIIFPRKLDELPTFLRLLAPLGFTLHSRDPHATRRIVDSFGLVEETLKHMQAAVIGGSFGTDMRIGGHNVWEPLVAGCTIVIGPHHANQQYLVDHLMQIGLLCVVSNDAHEAIRLVDEDFLRDDAGLRRNFIRNELLKQRSAAQRAVAQVDAHVETTIQAK